jgi:DNA end-binding protein Ku
MATERAAWVGTIVMGMVGIPVKLWRAARSRDIEFNYLHRTCGARIQHKRWCSLEEVEVPWADVSRGFEFAPDEYVVLTQEDFERLPLPGKHSVEISAFVDPSEIDPVFYDRAYYVVPDQGGDRPYALLLRTLAERNVSAIGAIAIRNREQVCAVRAERNYLVLDTLYYADEIAEEPVAPGGTIRLGEDEREMARTLVQLMRRPFQPAAYEDRYRAALAAIIEERIHGIEPENRPAISARSIRGPLPRGTGRDHRRADPRDRTRKPPGGRAAPDGRPGRRIGPERRGGDAKRTECRPAG